MVMLRRSLLRCGGFQAGPAVVKTDFVVKTGLRAASLMVFARLREEVRNDADQRSGGSGDRAAVRAWARRRRRIWRHWAARWRCVDINQAAAEAQAAAIGGIGVQCDVADAASGEAAFAAAAAAHGPVRILVNCAGIGTAGRIVGRDGPMQAGGVRAGDPGEPDRQLQHAAPGGGRDVGGRAAGGRRARGDRQHRLDRGI